MKALRLGAAGVANLCEIPDPIPPQGWVKLKILASSVCGSDLNSYKKGRPEDRRHMVSGHEFVGIIEENPNPGSKWKVGQRVCVYPLPYCCECEDCKAGRINICKNRKQIGGKDYNGGFAEYTVVPEYCLLEVPENISDIEAAMVEPFAVGTHAVNQAGGEKLKGGSIVIYGAGAIGLFALEAAKYYGVKQIIVLDMVPEKLEIAKAHGATDVILGNDTPEALQEKVLELTGGRGVDAVIDAVCLDVTLNNAIHFCRPSGTISVVGMTRNNFNVDILQVTKKELKIIGSLTYTTEMQDCLDILGTGKVSTAYIAEPVVPLCEGADALRKLVEKPAECIKAVFIP